MSRTSIIRSIIFIFIMGGLSVWLVTTELVFGWVATIFFAITTMILLVKHFKNDDQSKRTKTGDFLSKTESQQDEINNEDLSFSDDAFTIRIEQVEKLVAWKQVQSMIAYKMDRFASDNICLDVFCDNNINFTITEESVAWDKFLDHSKRFLPIDQFWEIEMVTPTVNNNLTVVYDRKNRSLKELLKKYYNN
ncbi:MAG: hypothetical protein ABIN67_00380 [Ferruginibacter sp.]